MQFAVGGRLEVRISASDVGKRVSVRSATGFGAGQGKFTDTVGILTSWTDGVLAISRRDGQLVQVAESRLVAGKVVPTAPARRRERPPVDRAELARVAARAWPPVESEPLGEWQLRAAASEPLPVDDGAGAAVLRRIGFTLRANSVLTLGDPGLPLDQALRKVVTWYAARELAAHAQVVTEPGRRPAPLTAALAEHGWSRLVTAGVWTAPLAALADPPGAAAGGDVRLTRTPGPAWLGRCHRFRGRPPRPEELAVLGGGPSVWFATVPGAAPADPAAAIGRCAVDGRWAGLTAIEVDPARRRRGLATAVLAALVRRALEEGASTAYLEVEQDNAPALSLYRGMGFTAQYSYDHWSAPQD